MQYLLGAIVASLIWMMAANPMQWGNWTGWLMVPLVAAVVAAFLWELKDQ